LAEGDIQTEPYFFTEPCKRKGGARQNGKGVMPSQKREIFILEKVGKSDAGEGKKGVQWRQDKPSGT